MQTSYLSELRETESAHREALVELQKMRETMEFMEQECAEMVTEVEAQIEKALVSMAVDIDDSDKYDSWPGSHLSSQSGGCLSRPSSQTSHSRHTSDASMQKQLCSFSTESMLVDAYDPVREDAQARFDLLKEDVIEEEEDDEAPQSPKMKHFLASGGKGQQDRMSAVDKGNRVSLSIATGLPKRCCKSNKRSSPPISLFDEMMALTFFVCMEF